MEKLFFKNKLREVSIRILFLLLLPVIFLIANCTGSADKFNSLPGGDDLSIIKRVKTLSDTNQQYHLYLPSDYDQSKHYPLILAFDPHGDGLLPVKLVQKYAEKYGYIVAGSDNSANGISNLQYVLQSLYNDVTTRYAVDKNRMYTLGFSGGARVAGLMALYFPGVKGVAGAGAGFQGNGDVSGKKFTYIGFCGTKDFNYPEMLASRMALSKAGIDNTLFTFEGNHAWPSDTLLEEAFLWFRIKDMKNGIIKSDHSFVKYVKQQLDKDIRYTKDNPLRQAESFQHAIAFLDGLENTDAYKKQLNELEQKVVFRQQFRKANRLLQLEQELREQYFTKIRTADTTWWKNEVQSLRSKIESEKDPLKLAMYQRTINYLSIISYSFSSRALSEGNYNQADRFLTIYRIVDPKNPDQLYMNAKLNYHNGYKEQTLRLIRQALSNGFTDKSKIAKDFPDLDLNKL